MTTSQDLYNATQAMRAAEAEYIADPKDPQKLAAYREAQNEYKRVREARQDTRATERKHEYQSQ